MTAANETIRRSGRELLAVLVAIMFLIAPMAEAAPVICDNDFAQVPHTERSTGDVARQGDLHLVEQKACCKSECSLCNVILPTSNPVDFLLDSGADLYFDPQQSIAGLTSPPALGPPRSLV